MPLIWNYSEDQVVLDENWVRVQRLLDVHLFVFLVDFLEGPVEDFVLREPERRLFSSWIIA